MTRRKAAKGGRCAVDLSRAIRYCFTFTVSALGSKSQRTILNLAKDLLLRVSTRKALGQRRCRDGKERVPFLKIKRPLSKKKWPSLEFLIATFYPALSFPAKKSYLTPERHAPIQLHCA
jgi:hypothetical protein